MFSRLASLVVIACSALSVAAQITILAPSSSYWWVANSQNLYSWTCGSQYNQGYTNFTVLINNVSPTVFNGPLALIAIQWDYDCSVLIPATGVAALPAGSGYTLSFANVYNQTDVIATSQQFEIKPLGSAYAPQPSGVASATVTASSSNTAVAGNTSATQTTTTKSGASATIPGNVLGYITAALGLVGVALAL